ncbi:dihydroxy-acid dehydratase [Faecalispora jeddahensis]|uniref:dihydroxy-acid dehydratase n=1 Tax=Faecalispora jeddahensis TaxID=1414721 RepID=UPI0028A7D24E|nr:dihydroxy-acid dehydratase [Faecalispora jeddahensis]
MEEPMRKRSDELTVGIERSAHRALLYSTGMTRSDFDKPLVAVVNSWNEIVPGHIHLREIAEQVKLGVTEAGGVPKEFHTIAVCDGMCQGHLGMQYPLPSRDVIADSIEIMVQSHRFDAMVLIPGCDKIVPGMIMAALRVNIPAIVLTAGPSLTGKYGEIDVITTTDIREFAGRAQKGEITMEELQRMEEAAIPSAGTCAMMGTANTMSCLAEVLGLTLPGCATALAVGSKKKRMARLTGNRIIGLLEAGITPRDIVTRSALENAIAASMALGGSTNSVLHLMAIAHEAGVKLQLEDFDRISRQVPYICNIKPSGRYALADLDEAGGIPAVLKTIEPHLQKDHLTVTGRTLVENNADIVPPENDVIFPLERPKRAEGGIAILRGNLAPDGAVVKQAGVKPSMYVFQGRARVFHSMEDASEAVSNDKIAEGDVIVIRYEGPRGGPGMREMHMTTSLLVGRGMDEKCALITDGRFSGSTRGPCIGHISPEAAAGGPIAIVEDGDGILIDIPNRRLELLVDDETIRRRLSSVQLLRKPRSGVLAKYAELVTSADKGAVLVTKESQSEEEKK